MVDQSGRTAVKVAAQLLFPPLCPACRVIVTEPGTVCGTCWPSIRFLEKPWCPVMGTPFAHDMGDTILSAAAIADPPPFQRLRSAAFHDGVAAGLVRQLKYHDGTQLARWMARWMLRAGSELVHDCDVIVPIPLHRFRLLQRRFNQAAELARGVADSSGKPLMPQILVRKRRTSQQVGLSQRARDSNVRGAFVVPPEQEIAVHGRRILLVDDVYTTGATAKAATRALLRAKAAAVDVLTFTRVGDEAFAAGDDGAI
jgi:ComF family protein